MACSCDPNALCVHKLKDALDKMLATKQQLICKRCGSSTLNEILMFGSPMMGCASCGNVQVAKQPTPTSGTQTAPPYIHICAYCGCRHVSLVSTPPTICNQCRVPFWQKTTQRTSYASYITQVQQARQAQQAYNAYQIYQQQGGQKSNMTAQGTTKCRIWWDKDIGMYQITTPYNKQFVSVLENLIPISHRGYDPETKIWVFDEKFFAPVKKLAETHWSLPGEVHVIDRATTERANASPTTQKAPMADICNEFMRLLPYDAALSAYRKAATTLHPDKGGDATKMARLNALWSRLQKEVYGQ